MYELLIGFMAYTAQLPYRIGRGMKYIKEYRDPELAQKYLAEIKKTVTQPWAIMEVCGGQTHSLVKNGKLPADHLATAYFCDSIRKWFSLCSSRKPKLALSRLNAEKSAQAFSFLEAADR